jgi:hypothetical protein
LPKITKPTNEVLKEKKNKQNKNQTRKKRITEQKLAKAKPQLINIKQ